MENRHLSRRQFFLSSFAATFSTTLLLSAKAHTISASGNQSDSLKFISVPPENGGMPAGVIVCLHGSGAKSQALVSLARSLNLPDFLFLFPDAPFPDPSVPGGKIWYDLKSSTHKGLGESRQRLVDWLKSLETITNLPLESTILSGFSQGGAMTLDVGLTLPLAGLICMSGYLHRTPQDIEPPLPSVLIVHGRQDTVVPLSAAHRLRDYLLSLGAPMQYKEFDMGHEIRPEVLGVIRDFILVNI